MRGFTGIISFWFQPHSVTFLMSKPKNLSFQRWTISWTWAVNSVKRREQWRSELRTLPGFLNVNALVKVVFNYLMRFRGSESLVTIDLIILERSEDRKGG